MAWALYCWNGCGRPAVRSTPAAMTADGVMIEAWVCGQPDCEETAASRDQLARLMEQPPGQ